MDNSVHKSISEEIENVPNDSFRCGYFKYEEEFGAGNETRTRDPDLGKVVLYQLSYSRLIFVFRTATALAAFTHLSHILL